MKVGFISAASQSTLYIVGTTVEGTRAAVTAGVPLARGSRARLPLVPQIVPDPLPLDGPVDATAFTARRHRDLVRQANGEAELQICLCRTLLDVIHALPPESTVVVGGPSGAIWPSREERLAHRLSRLGHQTVFVASRRGSWVHHGPSLSRLSLLRAPRIAAAPPDTSRQSPPASEPSLPPSLSWSCEGRGDRRPVF